MLFMVDPFEDLKRYITESGMALFMMDFVERVRDGRAPEPDGVRS